ncbi:axonemal dynein light intermediate polypeptide 1, partial [Manacus candei]|uniref:axonemal dynein light intermediate polypeptide 1 n=1 Tax=Manacus candei TaxID=415023 RepID=UPI002227BCB8
LRSLSNSHTDSTRRWSSKCKGWPWVGAGSPRGFPVTAKSHYTFLDVPCYSFRGSAPLLLLEGLHHHSFICCSGKSLFLWSRERSEGPCVCVQHSQRSRCRCCASLADELIRQTTVSCAERGLLLLRVRDELQLTLAAYQALYESSVAFGVRKALQAEQGKALMEKRIAELEEERRELEKQVSEEKAKCEAIEQQEVERREIEEKKHNEEVLFLKRTNQQLKTQLESIIAAKN